jgi:hypothetical protein
VRHIHGAYALGVDDSAKAALVYTLSITAVAHVRRMCSAWNAMADKHALVAAYPPPLLQQGQALIPGDPNFAHQTSDELANACAQSVHSVLLAVQASVAAAAPHP